MREVIETAQNLMTIFGDCNGGRDYYHAGTADGDEGYIDDSFIGSPLQSALAAFIASARSIQNRDVMRLSAEGRKAVLFEPRSNEYIASMSLKETIAIISCIIRDWRTAHCDVSVLAKPRHPYVVQGTFPLVINRLLELLPGE